MPDAESAPQPTRFQPTDLIENLNRIYDQGFASDFHEDFFSHSGFSNFGYWLPGTADARQAAEQLVLRLLEPLQPLQDPLLDVACGQGGTTRTLARFVPPDQITAINISQRQLGEAARRAPGSRNSPQPLAEPQRVNPRAGPCLAGGFVKAFTFTS